MSEILFRARAISHSRFYLEFLRERPCGNVPRGAHGGNSCVIYVNKISLQARNNVAMSEMRTILRDHRLCVEVVFVINRSFHLALRCLFERRSFQCIREILFKAKGRHTKCDSRLKIFFHPASQKRFYERSNNN